MGIFDWLQGKDVVEEEQPIQQRSIRVFNIVENVNSGDIVNALKNGDIALIKIVKNVEQEDYVVDVLNAVKSACMEIGGDVGRFSESWYIATPTNIRIQRKR